MCNSIFFRDGVVVESKVKDEIIGTFFSSEILDAEEPLSGEEDSGREKETCLFLYNKFGN